MFTFQVFSFLCGVVATVAAYGGWTFYKSLKKEG